MRAPSALIAEVRQRLADWLLEQRIDATKDRLTRCRCDVQAHALMDQLRVLVGRRSSGQVERMETRKGLR